MQSRDAPPSTSGVWQRHSDSPARPSTLTGIAISVQPKAFVTTTDSNHALEIFLNLARRMTLTGIDQLWVTGRRPVTQNAQSGTPQTRSFTYDRLSRMTSEQNPETGTVSYTYDSDAGCGITNNTGDLVKRHDAAGNNICYYHDLLHRLTDVGTPNGCRRFRYDDSTGVTGSIPRGITISNPMGRMVEAETDNCAAPITPKTDEWFSYSARGEVTDVYQSTPHSGGYYHLTASYFPHGLLSSLRGVPGMPIITYGPMNGGFVYDLDGEGRPTHVIDGSAFNLATNITYNNTDPGTSNEPVGALLSLNLGTNTSGQYDSDSFIYDQNTGRLKQYTFTVNGQTDTGQLTWNANGSLRQLSIVNGLAGAADSQLCNYAHDDLSRIASVNCIQQVYPYNPVWAQTFSYDPFGNITKSGNLTFNPGYVATTNRYVVYDPLGFTGPNYDNNGNLTIDPGSFGHRYSWDAEGHVLYIDNKQLTYDALGRMVEQVPSSGDTNCTTASDCTQIVYGPGGGKLALMHAQTLSKAFVPLPGGVTAVYNSSGLVYYRHSDHLGSSRLASTPARTVYYSGAYAPFGENYAESGTVDRSFTGQNQDTTFQGSAALYDFMFRRYSANQGRWISPDPAGLAAVSMTDPQTLNRYAYVADSPLDTIDPLGLGRCNPDGSCDMDLPNDSGGTFLGLTTLSALNIPTYAPGLEPVYSPETGLLMGFRLVPGIQLSSWLVLQSETGRGGNDGGVLDAVLNSTALDTLGEFFQGRRKGQSFGDCVKQNISLLTGGTVDPNKLTDPKFYLTLAGITLATATPVYKGVTLTDAALAGATFMLGMGGGTANPLFSVRAALVRSGGVMSRGIAIFGAAAAGTLIGSGANCAIEGIH